MLFLLDVNLDYIIVNPVNTPAFPCSLNLIDALSINFSLARKLYICTYFCKFFNALPHCLYCALALFLILSPAKIEKLRKLLWYRTCASCTQLYLTTSNKVIKYQTHSTYTHSTYIHYKCTIPLISHWFNLIPNTLLLSPCSKHLGESTIILLKLILLLSFGCGVLLLELVRLQFINPHY